MGGAVEGARGRLDTAADDVDVTRVAEEIAGAVVVVAAAVLPRALTESGSGQRTGEGVVAGVQVVVQRVQC